MGREWDYTIGFIVGVFVCLVQQFLVRMGETLLVLVVGVILVVCFGLLMVFRDFDLASPSRVGGVE